MVKITREELSLALAPQGYNLNNQKMRQGSINQDYLARMANYLIGSPRRGVVGHSRYAVKLRKDIHQAATDSFKRPVLIHGEPGLEKDNIARLIHFGSADRKRLLMRFNASEISSNGAELFGRKGSSEPSLLKCLADGNLLIDCIDLAKPHLRTRLIALATEGHPDFSGRVLFTTESSVKELDSVVTKIRVTPLRVRCSDLGDWLRYFVRLHCRKFGFTKPPLVPKSVVTRLQAHDFPNNIRELENVVERALRLVYRFAKKEQITQEGVITLPTALPEEVFWVSSRSLPQLPTYVYWKNNEEPGLRFDLWQWKPRLRQLMLSPVLWNSLKFGLISWLFVLTVWELWFGPQDRTHNLFLTIFWTQWWPLMLLAFPLIGRFWCSVCPFMVWGEIAQNSQKALSKLVAAIGLPVAWLQPRPWPHGDNDRWGSQFMAAGFAAILLWEEVWNLPDTARLSASLLLLITAACISCSLLFEKHFWCRFLCPIGGMNGLFSKLSISELRAQSGTCMGSCTTFACLKGGPAEGEGKATDGCPHNIHPAHLNDNRDCVLCLSCANACPHRAVQLRLRPPAADLQLNNISHAPAGERSLIFVLAGGITLHYWDRLLGWLPMAPESLSTGPLLPRLAFGILALSLPAITAFWLERPWLYASLPLLWGLLLARHLPLGMTEGGYVKLVENGSLPMIWPHWSFDVHVIGFCQSLLITLCWIGCVILLRRLVTSRWIGWITSSSALLGIAVAGRWLVAI